MSTEPYTADLNAYCQAGTGDVLERYAHKFDDVAADKLEPLFGPIDDMVPPVLCIRSIVGVLAKRVQETATPLYTQFLLSKMWGIQGTLANAPGGAAYLTPDYTLEMQSVFGRVPYERPRGKNTYSKIYFGCARAWNVDIREKVAPLITPDWSFGTNNLFSETWAHAKYLASFNDADALTALDKHLETVTIGNKVLAMLNDLTATPVISPGVRQITARYIDDARPTDNGIPELPTIPLGVEVQGLIRRLPT